MFLSVHNSIQKLCLRSVQEEPVAKRHHMVSGNLAPLYIVFGLKLGCSGAATAREIQRELKTIFLEKQNKYVYTEEKGTKF